MKTKSGCDSLLFHTEIKLESLNDYSYDRVDIDFDSDASETRLKKPMIVDENTTEKDLQPDENKCTTKSDKTVNRIDTCAVKNETICSPMLIHTEIKLETLNQFENNDFIGDTIGAHSNKLPNIGEEMKTEIQIYPLENKQLELNIFDGVTVNIKGEYDPMLVHTEMKHETLNEYECNGCSNEFGSDDEHLLIAVEEAVESEELKHRMCIQKQHHILLGSWDDTYSSESKPKTVQPNGVLHADYSHNLPSLSTVELARNCKRKVKPFKEADEDGESELLLEICSEQLDNESIINSETTRKLYLKAATKNGLRKPKKTVSRQNVTQTKKRKTSIFRTNELDTSTDNTDSTCQTTQSEVPDPPDIIEAENKKFSASKTKQTDPKCSNSVKQCVGSPKSAPFVCELCQFKCKFKSVLVKHKRIHSGIKPFSCTLCDYRCISNRYLTMHMKRHSGEKPYSCQFCEYRCVNRSYLSVHTRTHTGEKPYSCKVCDYSSISSTDLKRHMRTHTGEKPFSCNVCDYKCITNRSLVEHTRVHTGEKPFSCKYCQYRSARKENLVTHMRTHTGERPYSCKLCKYKSASSTELITHMRTHTGEKPYACKLCEYKCTSSSDLTVHVRTHTGEKPFACQFCDYKCIKRKYLTLHTRIHTGEKPFSCEYCEYKSARKENLVTHMRTHTGEKPFSCKHCPYKCGDRSVLSYHNMNKHIDSKPFSCTLCELKFINNSTLTMHLRTHTGEKPFSCTYCDYKCTKNNSLVKHTRIHTGEKPFSCNYCEYRSARKENLVSHMRTHTGEKPFACKSCTFKCAHNSTLSKHMKKHG